MTPLSRSRKVPSASFLRLKLLRSGSESRVTTASLVELLCTPPGVAIKTNKQTNKQTNHLPQRDLPGGVADAVRVLLLATGDDGAGLPPLRSQHLRLLSDADGNHGPPSLCPSKPERRGPRPQSAEDAPTELAKAFEQWRIKYFVPPHFWSTDQNISPRRALKNWAETMPPARALLSP